MHDLRVVMTKQKCCAAAQAGMTGAAQSRCQTMTTTTCRSHMQQSQVRMTPTALTPSQQGRSSTSSATLDVVCGARPRRRTRHQAPPFHASRRPDSCAACAAAPAWDADEAAATSAASAAPTYEELCRAHVDAIIAAAAAADVQTGLAARCGQSHGFTLMLQGLRECSSRQPVSICSGSSSDERVQWHSFDNVDKSQLLCCCRVSTWRQRVQPVIDAQDAREDFDMRTYGQRILQRLAQLSVADAPADVSPQQPQEQQQPAQPLPQQPAKRKKGRKGAALQQKSVPQPSEPPQQQQQQQSQRPRPQPPSSVAPLSAAIGDPEQWQVSR